LHEISGLFKKFVLFVAKKLVHTTKDTKRTKIVYFILLFLRDLRGKNKTDLSLFQIVRVIVS